MRIVAVAIAFVVVAAAVVALFMLRAPSEVERVRDPRFITLGDLAHDLSKDPKTFDALVDKLGTNVAFVDESKKSLLKKLFAAHDYEGLDKQPELTLDSLRVGLDFLAESRKSSASFPARSKDVVHEPLGIPTGKSAPDGEPFLSDVGLGLKHGDRVHPDKRTRFGDSERLAQVLEGLALQTLVVDELDSPRALMEKLAKEGHTIVVVDQRLAANFGDLEKDGTSVATPLWVSTGRTMKDGTVLALPVPHAQLLLSVRGPVVNADVTLYPALDLAGDGSGGTRFRADLTSDQPWCGFVEAHRYEGAQAIEAVRWMGELRRVVDDKVREKKLPLDGYFALGVCTLAPALVELALTGTSTLWPLTHDPALWDGATEVDALAKKLPYDGRGAATPTDARLKASVPWRALTDVPFAHTRAQLQELGWL
jgi:hypothetical protein